MTPFNLTTWGYNYVAVDGKDGSYGGMFSKLLLRELPQFYKPGSGHAHFPFVTTCSQRTSSTEAPLGSSLRPRSSTT
jgi:linoleate 10R-lipoxygenase